MGIYRGPGGTGDAVNDSSSETRLAVEARDAALAAQAAAEAAEAAALTSETNAATSEANAATSASNALASASNAASSASSSSSSATAASTSATNAASSATDSAASAILANDWATKTSGPVAGGEYSSKYNAQLAASSATAAATSATNAATSATTASTAATTATTQATSATNSATNAATSASTATTQASNASTSATSSANSATQAAASAAAASAISLGNEPVRHSVRPSLLLDFANTKTLDPRITFTRASTGTFYDGETVAKAEENLVLQSQFASGWSDVQVTRTVNATTAPDGTATAASIVPSTTLAAQYEAQTVAFNAATYTLSVFAKANGYGWVQLTNSANTEYANFNISSGVVGTVSSGSTSSITNVGNGWYRCSITFPIATAVSQAVRYFVLNSDAARGASFQGDGTSGVYLWGAQLEQRSSVTAYTATTTAPITNYIPALQTAASGVARFEHNPTTGESLGLEIEEQRTNLLTYSEQFDNAAWTKDNVTLTANAIVAPDGTLTADEMKDSTSSTQKRCLQNITVTSASHTISVYAKAGTLSLLLIRENLSGTAVNTTFNLANGTLGTVGSGRTATITSVGNGWYRCSLTVTAVAGTYGIGIGLTNADNINVYTGTGNGTIFIWGAQLEAGSFATSYIPTVASQVTRSADSASMTGTNFSSWYRADEGTVYADTLLISNSGTRVVWDIGPNLSFGNTIYQVQGSTAITVVSGNATLGVTLSSNTTLLSNKAATAIKLNDYSLSVNGAATVTDTSAFVPVSATQLVIGQAVWASNGTQLNGTLRKLAYYPKRLTNSELQGLTTV